MAIAVTGSVYSYTNWAASGNLLVTVPVDADICIVYMSGDATADTQVELNFRDANDAIDFTSIAAVGTNASCRAFYLKSSDTNWPGSGSQTLRWQISSAGMENIHIVCFFVTDVNITGDPIVDYETDDNASGTVAFAALTGVSATDMGVVGVWCYNYASTTVDINGQTSLYDAGDWSACAIGYEVGEDELTAATTHYTGPKAGVAFALLGVTEGGAPPASLLLKSPRKNMMRSLLVR